MPSRVATAKTSTRSTDMGGDVAHALPPPLPQLSDHCSWHADGTDALQGEQYLSATGPLPLPLKRGQFSASPATGLVGLQENGFLSDFFECLGFLSLASESAVRTAIFSVMRAAVREEKEATISPPLHVAGEAIQRLVDGGDRSEGYWDQAVPAGGGTTLPHDSITCLLWCAVALGALVRGCPFTNVEGYVELAQVSLTHCFDGITLDTARWERRCRCRTTQLIAPSLEHCSSPNRTSNWSSPQNVRVVRRFSGPMVQRMMGGISFCSASKYRSCRAMLIL
ncbi:unnamed protein product [Pylaiella littoralis]